ncbi:hypothetical protein SAMN05216365_10424 [Porphyromonadaceae bacterium NLAE-zl-C104]|jgi:hypothetical protein|nr:hypothetical protein SAMN05216331_10371 [Porphyromonadaceae bacterium KH3R12]SFS38229.1 hypothetical protein SAMN05216365_10424 [Porphyromonadaceae bacterium NLAE-zl-C104]
MKLFLYFILILSPANGKKGIDKRYCENGRCLARPCFNGIEWEG